MQHHYWLDSFFLVVCCHIFIFEVSLHEETTDLTLAPTLSLGYLYKKPFMKYLHAPRPTAHSKPILCAHCLLRLYLSPLL